MQTILYVNHQHLPFSGKRHQHEDVFEPYLTGRRQIAPDEKNSKLASETDIWPILLGLHKLRLPYLAHVSAFEPIGDNLYKYPERQWIQITTGNLFTKFDGIREVNIFGVRHNLFCLWSHEDNIHTPFELLSANDYLGEKRKSSAFWSSFFMKKLQTNRTKFETGGWATQHKAKLLSALTS